MKAREGVEVAHGGAEDQRPAAPAWRGIPNSYLYRKVSTWLRKDLGYDIRLFDCLFPSKKERVKQEVRKVVQVCSTIEWPLADYRAMHEARVQRARAPDASARGSGR
jgi:hypothetical protein